MNPFEALGLPVRAGSERRSGPHGVADIAADTHPDRPGGGDITAYTAAATAYAQLRTAWGRSEAYADLAVDRAPRPRPGPPTSPVARREPGAGTCCWSRPGSGTAGRCGWRPAPWPPRCCRCWSWRSSRGRRPVRPWSPGW